MKEKTKVLKRRIRYYLDSHSKKEIFSMIMEKVLGISIFLVVTFLGCLVTGFREIPSILLGMLFGGIALLIVEGGEQLLKLVIFRIKRKDE